MSRARVDRAVSAVTQALGSPAAIAASVVAIMLWAVTGPLLGFSDTWQLIANTATTLVTFVMVFVVQASQNRDGRALQVKLDAVLEALDRAPDDLVGVEDLPEADLRDRQQALRAEVTDPH